MQTEVAIVGGGPVGLCLATDLGWRGVSCVVFERRPRNDATFPTANHIGVRTMEHLRRLGLARDVARAFRPDWGGDWIALTHLGGREVARIPDALAGAAPRSDSPEHEVWAPKPCFDPILERAAESWPTVRIEYGASVEAVENTAHGVSCTIRAGDGDTRVVGARFAVACDGAGSRVRDTCGIELVGPPPIPFVVHSAFFRSKRTAALVASGGLQYWILGTPEGPTPTPVGAGLMVAVDGYDLWRLHGPGLDANDVAATKRRLGELGADDAEILATSAWTPRQGLCPTFRSGNIFLAGDAAHVVTPFGGLGVNTGMADAFDLGWKIEATLRGWGGPLLLDAGYEVERRGAALDLLAYQGLDLTSGAPVQVRSPLPLYDPPDDSLWRSDAAGEDARRRYGEGLVESRGTEFDKPAVDLGYRYDGSPLLWDDGSSPPDRTDHRRYVPSAKPGGRAPHVSLGEGGSLLDLFGRGFVLVRTTPAGDPSGLERAADAVRVPLRVETIPEAAADYGPGLTLVRPDGFVAWRGRTPPEDPAAVLNVITGHGTR